MSRKHTQALVAATEAVAALDGKTFVTRAPKGTEPPYMVWHPSDGEDTTDRVTAPRVTRNPVYTGHIVGETADQVQILTDLLKAELVPDGVGVSLTVAGEVSKPLWFRSPLPIQALTDPLPEVIYAVVEVGWSAQPE